MNKPDELTEIGVYGSSVATFVLWGLSVYEWAVVISACVTVLTFVAHVWFAYRRDEREQRLLEARLSGRDDASTDEAGA